MAEKLEDWIKRHVSKYKDIDVKKVYNELFFRDEFRPIFYRPNVFCSPADGVIIYQKKVKPTERILEVKGKNYTLCDILQNKNIKNCYYYVVGVFMTLYDVHINRMPTDGILRFEHKDPIQSLNLPMIFMEKGLFSNDLNYKTQDHTYLFNNERVVNTITYNKKGIKYNVVQIADLDVDTITHYSLQNPEIYAQAERFSFIRWGSQCDLIVPEHPDYEFEFVEKPMMHVQAGIDPILKFREKE